MTETYEPTEPLNPGGIISDSFRLMLDVPGPIAVVSLLPMAAATAVMLGAVGAGFAVASPSDDITMMLLGGAGVAMLIGVLAQVFAAVFLSAAVARIAIDQATGARVDVGAAIRTGIRNAPLILVLSILMMIVMYLGLALLIVPGLYVMGMWWLVVPAVIDEKAGFGALGRSFDLTEGYRWPMVGLILLYLLISIIAGAVSAVPGMMFGALGSTGAVFTMVIDAVVNAFLYALGIVTAVLAFNRLRQIKEGGGPGVADVFA